MDPGLSLIVPAKLSSPDKLITAARDRLSGKHQIHSYNYKGIISCSRDELDIRVAPQNVGRALRFMDTLIKGLRARGHAIQLRKRKMNWWGRLIEQRLHLKGSEKNLE